MPQALICFFEGESYEDVIRNCISIGGDSDTLAAIAGGIAEAYYGIPDEIRDQVWVYLPPVSGLRRGRDNDCERRHPHGISDLLKVAKTAGIKESQARQIAGQVRNAVRSRLRGKGFPYD